VATSLLGAIATVLWLIASLIAGDSGGPDVSWGGTPKGSSGAWPALLVLKRTTGEARTRQRNVERHRLVMWRGPATSIPGHVWRSDGSLVWAPVPHWSGLGAREFIAPIGSTRTEAIHLPTGSIGLVMQPAADEEVWLWLRGSNAGEALDAIEDAVS
jgi:hypothetical protein